MGTDFFLAMIGLAIVLVAYYLHKAVVVLNQICDQLKKTHSETLPGPPTG